MTAACFLCSTATLKQCQSCKIPVCSEYCRGKHLDDGSVCLPFRVENSETVGRHVIATRDILPTELIISGISLYLLYTSNNDWSKSCFVFMKEAKCLTVCRDEPDI